MAPYIRQFQMLGASVPGKQGVLPGGGKIRNDTLPLRIGEECLSSRDDPKGTPGKLAAIVINDGRMLAVPEIPPIPEGDKADLGVGTGSRVAHICAHTAIGQGDGCPPR